MAAPAGADYSAAGSSTVFNDVLVSTMGHVGDRNLHPILVFDSTDLAETRRTKAAFTEFVELALSLGGTMAAEHGVGTLKRAFLSDELDPVQLATQRRIRDALDPAGRLNPGKAL
ncbi:MAG: FAD-linked oxidase C-terminal domain-containing protein [Actinomycetota bacterium]